MRRYMSTCVKIIKGHDELPKICKSCKSCKSCKYFRPDNFYLMTDIFFSNNRYVFGKCRKSMNIDLITGKKTYDYASTVREFNCKGEWFESK